MSVVASSSLDKAVRAPSAACRDDALAEKAIRAARKSERKWLRQIAKAHASGDHRRVRHLTRRYAGSRAARICAVLRDDKQRARRARRARWSPARIVALAELINPYDGTSEPARLCEVPKSSGNGTRPIFRFGRAGQTIRTITRNAITAATPDDPRQFARKGVTAAVEKVKIAIEDSGHRWVAILDIANAFPSISNEEEVNRTLPIPAALARHGVWLSSEIELAGTDTPIAPIAYGVARRGLPQGAASSSIVAEIIIRDLLPNETNDVSVTCFADDIVITGKRRVDVEQAAEGFCLRLRGARAGNLTLKRCKIRRADWGFSFLGYEFRRRRGVLYVVPIAKHRRSLFECVAVAMLARYGDDQTTELARLRAQFAKRCDLLPVSPPLRVRVSSHCAPMGR